MSNRIINIDRASQEDFDLCIIGGGITGAGILHQAVERGYKVILVDKGDFASGTSSRSSKMIHGGVRYLKYLQLQLVQEALHERQHLLQTFPHLVKPFPFVLPSYHSSIDLWTKEIGLSLYDRLAGKTDFSKHKRLSTQQVVDKLPGINDKNLKGGILYWDGRTNDARLTVDVMALAAQNGAVLLNYVEVLKFEKDNNTIHSLICKDHIAGQSIQLRAKVIVNACGVWTDDILERAQLNEEKQMQATKGVHVIVPSSKFPKDYVAIVDSPTGDKRMLYTLPWEHNMTILGATDTEYTDNIDHVVATQEDVDYILQAFNESFPKVKLQQNDVIGVFAGLRPLLHDGSHNAYSRSREYKIWWTCKNSLHIAGGKLTSFLSMGQHCIEEIEKKFQMNGRSISQAQKSYNGEWKENYGTLGDEIEQILIDRPESRAFISEKYLYTIAEIVFFTRILMARQLEDMLTRRTTITYAMKDWDIALVKSIALIMAEELGENDEWMSTQIEKYYLHWSEYHPEFLKTSPLK